jgi:membrane-associated phospholipid phosphatase
VTQLRPRRPLVAIAGGLLTALIATLSGTGVLHGIDQYAVDHLTPWLDVRPHRFVTIRGLLVPRLDPPAPNLVLELWTYPAAVLPSLLIVLAAASRVPRPDALAWIALWCAGNALEVFGKLTLHKPDLFRHGVHVVAFDMSLPSGHTIRAIVLAAAVASAWRWGWLALLWAASIPFALVVAGHHAPSDVAAGATVAFALLAWAPTFGDSKTARASSHRAIARETG